MALRTLGTNTTTSLPCLVFSGMLNAQDFGNLKNMIKANNPNSVPLIQPEMLEQSGILKLPGGRGLVTAQPGDVIAIDPVSGWPILLSANAIAIGAFTLT